MQPTTVLTPADAELLRRAEGLIATGALDDAARCCRQVLQQRPGNTDAMYLAATIAHQRGLSGEAVDLLAAANTREPSEPRHLILLASIQHSLGRLEAAIEALDAAGKLTPMNAAIQFNLGLIERQRGANQPAARQFRKVLALDPGHAPALALLGRFYRPPAGDPSDVVLASRFLALDSLLPDALLFVFDAMKSRDPAGAADRLSGLLQRFAATGPDPAVGMALAQLGFSELVNTGYWCEAVKLLPSFGTFREAWWHQLRRSGLAKIVIDAPVLLHRIGEIALQLGALAKAKELGWFPDVEIVLLTPGNGGANPAYLEYWRKWFTFRERSKPPHPQEPRYEIGFEQDESGRFHTLVDAWQYLERAWIAHRRQPLLALTQRHREAGAATLRRLGIPEDAWFVVLHVREKVYIQAYGDTDDHNSHRNANVLDYLEAAQEIVSRGGWVLRIGHPGTRPLPKMERIIDVAHLEAAPEFDIFLLGACRFFLGDTSGPCVVAATFGRPLVTANYQMGFAPFQPEDLYAPKLYRDIRSKRWLSFARAFAPPLFRPNFAEMLAREGVEAVDNTPAEIAELTREMLDRLEGKVAYTSEDDTLQDRFNRLLPAGAAWPNARIGRDFIRTHAALLR